MDALLAMSVAQEVAIDGRPAIEDSAVRQDCQLVCPESELKYAGTGHSLRCRVASCLALKIRLESLSVHPRCVMASYLMDLLGASGAIADEALAAKARLSQRAMGAPGSYCWRRR